MKNFIFMVGFCMILPIMALEAIIKTGIIVLLFPTILVIAIFYPIIKKTKTLYYIEKWVKYSFTWKKGFYSGKLIRYWY